MTSRPPSSTARARPDDLAVTGQQSPNPLTHCDIARPVVLDQAVVGAAGPLPGSQPPGELGEQGTHQRGPVPRFAQQRQRGRIGNGELVGAEADVEAQPHHHRLAGGGHVGEDARQLLAVDQDVVRPFQAGPQTGHLGQRIDDRDAGQQREPTPLRGGDPGGRNADRHQDLRARHPLPGPPDAAPPRGLVFGEQHRRGRISRGDQIVVGGTGFVDDVEPAPEVAGSDQAGAQCGGGQGGSLSSHRRVAFRRSGRRPRTAAC